MVLEYGQADGRFDAYNTSVDFSLFYNRRSFISLSVYRDTAQTAITSIILLYTIFYPRRVEIFL